MTRINQALRASAVEKLLPPGAVAFEMRGDASSEALFPSERECISRAVEKRVREFAAGRLCARAGLAELGFAPSPLLSRRDRVPLWPADAVGSITHTAGYCLAVVGLRSQFAALGVDAEWIGGVDPELWRLTMTAEERAELARLDEHARSTAATVTFSAKEAFYKCQYALTRRWLGFEDVVASIGENAFSITVTEPTHPLHRSVRAHAGNFSVTGDLVIAAVALSYDATAQLMCDGVPPACSMSLSRA